MIPRAVAAVRDQAPRTKNRRQSLNSQAFPIAAADKSVSPTQQRKRDRDRQLQELREVGAALHSRRGKPDHRRTRLLRVGRERLEIQDYDRMTVTAVVRQANCSVGAFYSRFATKITFVDALIADAFGDAAAKLEPLQRESWWREKPLDRVIDAIVELMLQTLGKQFAGALRAAIKRSHVAPDALAPLHIYRQAATETVLKLLVPRLRVPDPTQAVHIAMQVLLATVIDTCLCKGEVFSASSVVLQDQLVHMIARHLGPNRSRRI